MTSNVQIVNAVWRGEKRFDVGTPDGPAASIDGDGKAGPGPVNALLGALASCAAMDVVDYLAKRRTPVESLETTVTAERRATAPRRVMNAQLQIRITGEGIDATHATRAIALAYQQYCSVAASLAKDLVIETQLVLNGIEYHPERQIVTETSS